MSLTLDQLISEAIELFAPADAPTRYFAAALSHGKAFRRKLIDKTTEQTLTALLELGNDRTVELPPDYVRYERLGVLSDDEQQVYGLSYGDVLPTTTLPALRPQDWPHEWMRTGGFKIDPREHRIVCNSLVPEGTILVLDYKSYSAEDGQDIALPPAAHTWGLKFILTELHKQKKDWQAAADTAADRDKEYGLYKEAMRNFSLAGVKRVARRAAAQRWK